MNADVFWSFFAMPIGLTICFGPMLVVWLVAEIKDSASKED